MSSTFPTQSDLAQRNTALIVRRAQDQACETPEDVASLMVQRIKHLFVSGEDANRTVNAVVYADPVKMIAWAKKQFPDPLSHDALDGCIRSALLDDRLRESRTHEMRRRKILEELAVAIEKAAESYMRLGWTIEISKRTEDLSFSKFLAFFYGPDF